MEHKGGLVLSGQATATAGGDNGPAVAPGKPDESLLWQRIAADEMPPKKPLPAAERAVLREWIASGAKWGSDPIDPFRFTSDSRAGYDWWSLQSVARPRPPAVKHASWPRGDIDRFVLARAGSGRPSPVARGRPPHADPPALFDLLGLPPTPEEVEAFVADRAADAYARLVDRLLASPHYGERWARHWLDVVRFGESQGFERDKLRPNAWRYRDWVIDALNRDMPYDEFARLQLAGDVLRPGDGEAVIATGFLVTGPYDEVGQMQQSAAMKAVVRQDELEDVVSLVGQTFLGLTVHCARCHDHKFDPIPQREYYRLVAALAGVRHGERDAADAALRHRAAQQAAAVERQTGDVSRQIAVIEGPILQQIARQRATPKPAEPPRPIARWEFEKDLADSLGKLHGTAHGGARLENGRLVLEGRAAYVATAPLDRSLKQKTLEAWLTLSDLSQAGGAAISVQTLDGGSFDAIVYGEREARRWMAGSDFYRPHAARRRVGGSGRRGRSGPRGHRLRGRRHDRALSQRSALRHVVPEQRTRGVRGRQEPGAVRPATQSFVARKTSGRRDRAGTALRPGAVGSGSGGLCRRAGHVRQRRGDRRRPGARRAHAARASHVRARLSFGSKRNGPLPPKSMPSCRSRPSRSTCCGAAIRAIRAVS